MTDQLYKQANQKDKEHFIKCPKCNEMIDCRNLDEIFQHETDHKPKPDIQYSGSKRIK